MQWPSQLGLNSVLEDAQKTSTKDQLVKEVGALGNNAPGSEGNRRPAGGWGLDTCALILHSVHARRYEAQSDECLTQGGRKARHNQTNVGGFF